MWTGRQTLGEIEDTIGKLQAEESGFDTSLASATADAERLRRQRSDALSELARIKLGEIEAGRIVRDLDAAENRARQLLESRRMRLQALTVQRTAAIAEMQQAEAQRHAAAAEVEAAVDAVAQIRAKVESEVKATAAWVDQSKVADAADAMASEAEKKAATAEAELGEKKRPYDADPLFAYLWANGFGTSRYAGGGLTRLIDGKIADFIGFSDARANYHMLIEIPQRLREHATSQRATADAHKADLAGTARQAMIAAGIEPKETALAEARHRLATADDTAEKKRGILKAIDEQRAGLVDGTGDATYKEALQTIASAAATADIATLRRDASRTATPADDAIVARIADIDDRLAKAEQEIARLRGTAQDIAARRLEMERVRDRFRSAGFDHPNARFGNDSEIGSALGQILEGAVRSGILWDLLRGGFSTRGPIGRPDFGAPSFPFPFPLPGGGNEGARGGQWREPGTRGGWSPPFDMPGFPGGMGGGSGGGRRDNDDGFSTGGSF